MSQELVDFKSVNIQLLESIENLKNEEVVKIGRMHDNIIINSGAKIKTVAGENKNYKEHAQAHAVVSQKDGHVHANVNEEDAVAHGHVLKREDIDKNSKIHDNIRFNSEENKNYAKHAQAHAVVSQEDAHARADVNEDDMHAHADTEVNEEDTVEHADKSEKDSCAEVSNEHANMALTSSL